MCDYCDCRSQWTIAELGDDHERLGDLARLVRSALDRGDVATARTRFEVLVDVLDEHAAVEEAGLFAALRLDRELIGDVDALVADHDAAAAAIVGLPDEDEAWARSVGGVLDDLRTHIEREEYDVYPVCRVALAPEGWEHVESVHRTRRRPVAGPPGALAA